MTEGPFSGVSIVHDAVPGRVRIRVQSLHRAAGQEASVEETLQRIAGVVRARASARTGSVLVVFQATIDTLDLIERVGAALGQTVQTPARRSSTPSAEGQLGNPRRSAAPMTHVAREQALDAMTRMLTALRRRTSSDSTASLMPANLGHTGGVPATAAARGVARGEKAWHAMSAGDVLAFLRSSERGLDEGDAQQRRMSYGTNELAPPKERSELAMFFGQFKSVPVALLGASAVLSAATGGVADAAAILVVVLINAGIGYATESKAENIISSLSQRSEPTAPVRRAGQRLAAPTESVVPGDVLLLGAGAFVAADARLLEEDGLVVDESALTGESVPVQKSESDLGDPNLPLAERRNMVFRGTLVTGGSGAAVVVATGSGTEIGQIQSLVGTVTQPETPLQRQLRHLGVDLAVAAGSVCAGVFAIGLLRGYPLLQMLKTAVSLAVAAIPEGLPTVAITTLALGIRRMQEKKVLVRHLTAVETLGAIQVMCLDKTGTITVNRMTVLALSAGMRDVRVTDGRFEVDEAYIDPLTCPDLDALLRAVVLCNDVELMVEGGAHVLRGSATEAALIEVALDARLAVGAIREAHTPIHTQYRSEKRSFMATLHRHRHRPELVVSVKGRTPEVLAMCRYYQKDGEARELTEADRLAIETASERMASQALRVLGVARREISHPAEQPLESSLGSDNDLVWLGLVGMSDPPREGMRQIIERFHDAGIRTVMITGDQGATAYAVGRAIALGSGPRLEILDSTELDRIEPEVLRALAQRVQIFSRVSPAHKLKIVQALQSAGLVVAMTGDGINDSPALKAADVGVAMGRMGTAAAREVADVILADDDLATMIVGVEQGRTIYDDIKKAVHFILSTNMSEILLTFAGIVAGLETLTPMQLLWINLMTDIFPELALAVQPPEAEVLKRGPREPGQPMFARPDLVRIGVEGTVLTAGALAAYAYGLARYGAGPRAGTMAFTALTSAQLLHVLPCRSERHTIFDPDQLAKNKYIPMALGGSLVLQLAAAAFPGTRRLLGVAPLGVFDWTMVGLCATVPLVVNEAIKMATRKGASGPPILAVATGGT